MTHYKVHQKTEFRKYDLLRRKMRELYEAAIIEKPLS